MPDAKETGQLNYEAFAAVMGLTARWSQLPSRERDAWRVAAHEVMQRGWSHEGLSSGPASPLARPGMEHRCSGRSVKSSLRHEGFESLTRHQVIC
jgi:hypothetical protein